MLINSDNPTSSGGETNRILGKISPDSYTTCWGKFAFYCATRLVQIELVNAPGLRPPLPARLRNILINGLGNFLREVSQAL